MTICMQPIGTVRSPFAKDGVRISRRHIIADIVIQEELAAALTGIEEWSHLIVLFWMDQLAGSRPRLTAHPRGRDDLPEVGVLSMRGRDRPNRIGLAVVELLRRRRNILTVRALDAYDGSPVLDVKHFDRYDAVTELRAPEWWMALSSGS